MTSNFKVEHDFSEIPLERFIAHINDPKLNRMLEEGLGFEERTLIKREENNEGPSWQFRVRVRGELPGALKKIIKSDAFGWLETSRLVEDENTVFWQINSDNMLKFRGEGVWRMLPLGKGTKRVIEGSITVDIPLVGKMVEAFIVNELVKAYEIEPSIQKKFYAAIS